MKSMVTRMTNERGFVSWIEELGERLSEQQDVRISVREQEEWIERRSIVEDNGELELKAEPAEETRYYLRTDNKDGHIEKWKRYRFPLIHEERENASSEDGIEVLLEIPASVKDKPPWKTKEIFSVPSDVLNYVYERDGFSPVDANRVAGLEAEK